MKNVISFSILVSLAVSLIGCQTSYDAYGNPRNTVNPGAAAAGVAAAGLLGYAISKNKRDDRKDRYRHYDDRRNRYDHDRNHYSRGRGNHDHRRRH